MSSENEHFNRGIQAEADDIWLKFRDTYVDIIQGDDVIRMSYEEWVNFKRLVNG